MFSLNNGVITIKKQGDYTEEVAFSNYGSAPTYMFFSNNQGNSMNYGNLMENNARVFIAVKNSNTNAEGYSDKAFFWDEGVLMAKMPAGNWTHFKIFRRGDDTQSYSGAWNQSEWFALDATKNYYNNGTWSTYTPSFYVPSPYEAISGRNDWTWNGNGTSYTGTCTKTLDAGTYKFKITCKVNLDGTTRNNWNNQTELNYFQTNSSLSNVTLSSADGAGGQIQFTVPGSSPKDVTIQVSEYGVTVNAVDHGSTPDPDPTPTPSEVTFDGNEYFFWNTNVSSWGTVLAGKDRTQFLQFKNTTTNATAHTKLAFLWEQTGTDGSGNVAGILAAKAPSGEWNQVRHCRVNADSWNEGFILGTGEGSTGWIDLQEGNYMYKDGGSIQFTTKVADHFKFFLSGTVALAGGSGEFNPWNGNGTLYTDNVTKTLEAGDYKFKINPDMTIYDNRGGVDKWTNEFNMDDLDAENSSNDINLHNGNNKEIWFHLDIRSQVTIACDGSKVTVVATPIQQYTVTFNTDGGSTIDPVQVTDGNLVAQPADPTKSGYNFENWQLSGSDYNFSSPVTGNITLTAVWTYKAISSISLSESEHMTWVGNTDFELTYTSDPSDAIAKSVTWNSSNTSVATVSNGTVTAISAGTATITCTVTDQFDTQKTATCIVTVAACEVSTDNLYSMTVTGYNSKTGDNADLNGLWNESSEPATIEIEKVKIEYKDNSGNNQAPIAVDADHRVKAISGLEDESDYWYRIPTGETIINGSHTYDVYYLKNVKTGEYIYADKSTEYGNNGDYWHYWATRTSATNAETDVYKWFTAVNYDQGDRRNVIVCKDGFNNTYTGDGARPNIGLYRTEVNPSDAWKDPYIKCGQKVMNGYQNSHTGMVPSVTVTSEDIPNPAYLPSQMNTSYYRMNTDATVQANLTDPLVEGATITVRLYADAATTVKLTKTNGTDEVATINLTANTELDYTYTVGDASPLLGESAFVIKASDNHAGIKSIEVSRTYALSLAELIEETEAGGTLTLSCDYPTDYAVINKAITIDGQNHTIGNLTVEKTGDLTLESALTVNNFTICAKAGNTSTPAASGQVRNASDLTVNGNAYFLYTVDPSGQVHYGWYDFTVPFPVNAATGIKGIQNNVMKEDFTNGVDYAIMDYNGEKQAQGQYPYKKFSGVMQPNQLYSITMDDEYNYNTLRMQKTADGALVASNTVILNTYTYAEYDEANQNWNGVGNGTLHHADADDLSSEFVQVYQSGDKTFLAVEKSRYSFVVGTAFMVQEAGSMTLNQATHTALLAPKRYADVPATAIQIAREGQPFSDQLFITASETGGQTYTPGVDLAKAGDLGSANVPQIWTTAYNNPLCVHEAQLIDGEASYNLSLYAPAAGTYTLTSLNIPADHTLYLTQNGTTLCNLSETYTLDLNKGVTTEYGLLLVEIQQTPTGIDAISSQPSEIRKIMCNGVLYILHNGKVYNAQGAKVK